MNIEREVFFFLNDLTGNYFYLDFLFFFLAEVLPYLIAFVIFYFLLRNFKKHVSFVSEVFVAGFFARIALVETIRQFVARSRPGEEAYHLIPLKESFSYPSGHVAFLFAVSTAVYFHHKKAGILLFSLSLLTGLSRIFAGIHWPFDVIAGILAGCFSGIVISEIFRLLRKKKEK